MTKQERETFLADLHVGIISVPEQGRGPLTVPIWYLYEPGGQATSRNRRYDGAQRGDRIEKTRGELASSLGDGAKAGERRAAWALISLSGQRRFQLDHTARDCPRRGHSIVGTALEAPLRERVETLKSVRQKPRGKR